MAYQVVGAQDFAAVLAGKLLLFIAVIVLLGCLLGSGCPINIPSRCCPTTDAPATEGPRRPSGTDPGLR